MSVKPVPYRPAHEPMPALSDHTLVRPVGSVPEPVCPFTGDAARLWQTAAAAERGALSVLELAAHARMSRGAVVVAVTELVRQNQARVSRPMADPVLTHLSDNLGPTYYDPALVSAKVLVLGSRERMRDRFITANAAAVRVWESAPARPGQQTCLSMARMRLAMVELCLLSVSDPAEWPTLWPGAVRDAYAAVVVTTAHTWQQEKDLVDAARNHGLPVQLVVDHSRGPGPDLNALTAGLGLAPDQVTLCDVDSGSGSYGAVRDVVHRSCRLSPVPRTSVPEPC
ncbi:hypothetical protein GCM10007147_44080 [Nocardiopsis kunsanensis]|uniref:Uncharacterized protein n=1 Tax=Nocardiopsis kunsanensis TaxID=141693 RepID=A0A919CM96_9ACTN|nr:hypothetical protein [Nocardiopsis kunsanensis]GHD36611.1 hypothetical protein GCM10007147_44080 [Nocardiopsis kunsanensis]